MLSSLKQNAWRFLPALFLILVIWILGKGLYLDKKSQGMDDKSFPGFSLFDIRDAKKSITQEDLIGKVTIVHIWASWCGICVKEHQDWINIKNQWPYPFVGIVYRDSASQVISLLKKQGDPYDLLINDQSGNLGLELGIVGTPITYIVDKEGVIRFHHLGPVSYEEFENQLLPLMNELEQA